jgi:hypothetical protein
MGRDLTRIEALVEMTQRVATEEEARTVANYARQASLIGQARKKPAQRFMNKSVAELLAEVREDPELLEELAGLLPQ